MNLGLLVRKECWTLSWSGRLLALACASLVVAAIAYGAYPFLAVSDPVRGDFIVLEGWAARHPGVLKALSSEFERGNYRHILIVLQSFGEDEFNDQSSSNEDISDALAKYGVPRPEVSYVMYPAVQRDRTYNAAIATKSWFALNKISSRSLDVVTLGPHARRSWLTFQHVFGNNIKVGVIAENDRLYDPEHWWQTSEGLREVQGEAVAYIYAHLYFLWR